MIFSIFTLAVALSLSLVSAYYSVLGLMAIFAAAALPIAVMGVTLEIAKITTTVWLHYYWEEAPKKIKVYLFMAVGFLMLLTSLGSFGFLSKAHLDQGVPTGDVQQQVDLFDEKIKTQRDNIDAAKRALTQLDAAVDQLMSRTTDANGATKAANLRRAQTKERKALQTDIDQAQKDIANLQEERAPIASKLRKVEAEVGPIKYIAAMIYGDKTDQNMLEAAVRWVIIVIIFVFDPLAVVLILAATTSLDWARQARAKKKLDKEANKIKAEVNSEENEFLESIVAQLEKDLSDSQNELESKVSEWTLKEVNLQTISKELEGITSHVGELHTTIKKLQEAYNIVSSHNSEMHRDIRGLITTYDDLMDRFNEVKTEYDTIISALEMSVAKEVDPVAIPEPIVEIIPEPDPIVEMEQVEESIPEPVIEALPEITSMPEGNTTLFPVKPEVVLPEPLSPINYKFTFIRDFPTDASMGDMHLNTSRQPFRLYKFNGHKWMEVNKDTNSSYQSNPEYIQFLIESIENGFVDADDLSDIEREEITNVLMKEKQHE